jgi:hypothetical protein
MKINDYVGKVSLLSIHDIWCLVFTLLNTYHHFTDKKTQLKILSQAEIVSYL